MRLRRSIGVLGVVVAALVSGCGGSDEARPDLVFVSTRDGDYAIFEMDADGSAQRRLTPREADDSSPARLFFQVDPSWSPDGTKIAFASRRSGRFHVYVMSSNGTGTQQITSGRTNDSHPSWSPDGERIVFERSGDIFVAAADGSNPIRISDPAAEEREPTWSPDGRWIVYVQRTPGTTARELWVMRADGSERRALTRHNATVTTPAWSPDSSRIAYATNKSGVYELFTIGVDGTGSRSVVATASDNFEPAWSPDGSKIAYYEDGAIFTVELGGGDVEKLTDNETNDSSPAWNPIQAPVDED